MLILVLFDDVFDEFLDLITDVDLLKMLPEDVRALGVGYLKRASIRFKECKKMESINIVEKRFDDDLTLEEITILANLMVVEWLKPIINNIKVMEPVMTTRDYQAFSKANHIDKLMKLKNDTMYESGRMIQNYSQYEHGKEYFGDTDEN